MVSLEYRKIFSRHIGLLTDFTLPQLDPKDFEELEIEWLHRAISEPRVRHIFSSLSMDDDLMIMEFEINNPIDDYSDENYVTELLALSMAISWYQPQVDSIRNIAVMIGTDKEKTLLNNYKNSLDRLKELKIERQKLIRDYGYLNGI